MANFGMPVAVALRTWPKRILRLLAAPLAFYLAIVLVVAVFQRRLLYFPMPAHSVHTTAQEEALTIQGPDGTIEAWLIRPDLLDRRPLVVVCGGNAENAAHTRFDFLDQGWPVLCWNYPGYGASDGAPGEAAIIAAGEALLTDIEKRYSPQGWIFFGRSLGSAVAIALAVDRAPAAMILIAPPDSIAAVAGHHYPFLPIRLLIRDPWLSAERAAALDCPALMLVADGDRVIPPTRSQALAERWPGPVTLRLLSGVDHNSMGHHPDYWPTIATFIETAMTADHSDERRSPTRGRSDGDQAEPPTHIGPTQAELP